MQFSSPRDNEYSSSCAGFFMPRRRVFHVQSHRSRWALDRVWRLYNRIKLTYPYRDSKYDPLTIHSSGYPLPRLRYSKLRTFHCLPSASSPDQVIAHKEQCNTLLATRQRVRSCQWPYFRICSGVPWNCFFFGMGKSFLFSLSIFFFTPKYTKI